MNYYLFNECTTSVIREQYLFYKLVLMASDNICSLPCILDSAKSFEPDNTYLIVLECLYSSIKVLQWLLNNFPFSCYKMCDFTGD